MKPENIDNNVLLSNLWIFVSLNYIFCDVFTLMYGPELNQLLAGVIGGIQITQGFLLTFAFIMEISMIMIILSRVLRYKVNRWVNIIAGLVLTFVQAVSLVSGNNTYHYVFFSIVEIATTIFIIRIAWKWSDFYKEAE